LQDGYQNNRTGIFNLSADLITERLENEQPFLLFGFWLSWEGKKTDMCRFGWVT